METTYNYKRTGVLVLVMLLTTLYTYSPLAQQVLRQRQDSEQYQLPSQLPPKRFEGNVLPRIPLPDSENTDGVRAGKKIFVRSFLISGNTVVSTSELLDQTKNYVGRSISYTELTALRDRMTQVYIDYGYISSGATIPTQEIENGVVKIRIVEGKLTGIVYQNKGRLNERYVRGYIDQLSAKVLNIASLERQLQYLKHDKRIEQIQAVVLPSETLGESLLEIKIIESKQFYISGQYDNYQTPSVGSLGGKVNVAHTNVTGFGDSLGATYRISEGLSAYHVYYEWPLHSRDTAMSFQIFQHESDIIEPGFSELDFESSGSTYSIGFKHAVYRSQNSVVDLALKSELRDSHSVFLDGVPFEGDNKTVVVRFPQSWSNFRRDDDITLRSTFSWGKAEIKGKESDDDARIGSFLSWLGQFHWTHKFRFMNSQFSLRSDLQISNSPLLGMEQFSLGGHASVRGYRENTLISDNGWVASISYNFPLWSYHRNKNYLNLSTFVDYGKSWNDDDDTLEQRDLLSLGVGISWSIYDSVRINIDWAKAQKEVPESVDYDLQDDGVHFSIVVAY